MLRPNSRERWPLDINAHHGPPRGGLIVPRRRRRHTEGAVGASDHGVKTHAPPLLLLAPFPQVPLRVPSAAFVSLAFPLSPTSFQSQSSVLPEGWQTIEPFGYVATIALPFCAKVAGPKFDR